MILFAIVYLGYGMISAYSSININKSIFICDFAPNINEGGVINPPDIFGPRNIEPGKCKQQSWGVEDITTFVAVTVLWLPLILFHR